MIEKVRVKKNWKHYMGDIYVIFGNKINDWRVSDLSHICIRTQPANFHTLPEAAHEIFCNLVKKTFTYMYFACKFLFLSWTQYSIETLLGCSEYFVGGENTSIAKATETVPRPHC